MKVNYDFSGRVVLIAGAGSGVGRSVALAMMKEGYSVVLAGRRQDDDDLRSLARSGGQRAGQVAEHAQGHRSRQALQPGR